MKVLFKNTLLFSVAYFIILFTDIIIKDSAMEFPYRFLSKPLIIISLLFYYVFNSTTKNKQHFILVSIGLFCFLVGDIFLINNDSFIFFLLGIVGFLLGKVCYIKRFSNSQDFNIYKLMPFMVICFFYVIFLFTVIYDGVGKMFLPVLVYFFVDLMVALMAYLRKDLVSQKSFFMVLFGVLCTITADSVLAIKEFSVAIAYQGILVMLFYGFGQFLIINGLLQEEQLIN